MGYTHYWSQKRDYTVEEWRKISETIKSVISESGVSVVREYDSPNQEPLFNGDEIVFNGSGDDGHETFYFTRKIGEKPSYRDADAEDFQFCKTACKPYDVIVVASLIAATEMGVISWSSDGDEGDHEAGLALFESIK